jgi:hypothetical protein
MEDELFIRLIATRFSQILGEKFNEGIAAAHAVDIAKAASIGATICFKLRDKYGRLTADELTVSVDAIK